MFVQEKRIPIISKIGDGQEFVECCLCGEAGISTKEGWPLRIRRGKIEITTEEDNPLSAEKNIKHTTKFQIPQPWLVKVSNIIL